MVVPLTNRHLLRSPHEQILLSDRFNLSDSDLQKYLSARSLPVDLRASYFEYLTSTSISVDE